MLEVRDLCAGYDNGYVLQDISFDMPRGTIMCVLGSNGCGKTTLFRALTGVLQNVKGDVLIDNTPLVNQNSQKRASLVSYIPQNHTAVYDYTVQEMVMMGKLGNQSGFKAPSKDAVQSCMLAMEKVGILHFAKRVYTRLSGGERKMVLIARAVSQNAKLLIMDEPTADLDFANKKQVCTVMTSLAEQGYGILFSTHSPELPFKVSQSALLLKNGRALGCGATNEVITSQSMSLLYDSKIEVAEVNTSDGIKRVCLS